MFTISKQEMPVWAGVVVFLSFIFFMACDTEKPEVNFEEEEKSAYEAEESTENLFDVIESITTSAINVAEANTGGRIAETVDPELACATVSFDGTRESGRIAINFGDGCEGPDGRIRKGEIVVEYVGHWLTQDAKIYTVLKNFFIDDLKIEGTRILTNVSVDLESLVYMVEIIGGKVIWPDQTFLTRESDRTHTWVFGNGLDDFQLHVEGVASGKTRFGVEYMSEVIQPLIFKSSCRGNTIYLPTSGIKTITIPEKPVITVNYGNNDCDNKFTISIGEASKEVSI